MTQARCDVVEAAEESEPEPGADHRRRGDEPSVTHHHRRIGDDTPTTGIQIRVPGNVSRHVGTLLVGGFVTLGGGSGIFASHTSLSGKVDKVLESQAEEKIELAAFKADVMARLKALERRDDEKPR